MPPIPRIISQLPALLPERPNQLRAIFSRIAKRGQDIQINNRSIATSLIFGISDGIENGSNFRDWRFQTNLDIINAHYFEIWLPMGNNKYFLDKSYFHLYTYNNDLKESEYILLHCDASEPNDTPHSIYKKSPHLHIEVAEHPIPKAHFALYNGRVAEVLRNIRAYNIALSETIEMINSQVLEATY